MLKRIFIILCLLPGTYAQAECERDLKPSSAFSESALRGRTGYRSGPVGGSYDSSAGGAYFQEASDAGDVSAAFIEGDLYSGSDELLH